MEPELAAKRLELLKQMVPQTLRFAVLVHPDNASVELSMHEVEATGRTLGVAIKRFDVTRPDDFETVVIRIAREGFGGVVVVLDSMFFAHRATLVEHLGQHRLPAAYPLHQFVEAGGLMAYAVNLTEVVARGAAHVAKILGGEKPSNIPVERPTKFELVINRKTAQALGITTPPALLFLADEVIQ
jgi:putative ABC transport system substrate-binding protein